MDELSQGLSGQENSVFSDVPTDHINFLARAVAAHGGGPSLNMNVLNVA